MKTTDEQARVLETIVIDLVQEIEERLGKKVDKDTYEIIQAHIWDSFDYANKS